MARKKKKLLTKSPGVTNPRINLKYAVLLIFELILKNLDFLKNQTTVRRKPLLKRLKRLEKPLLKRLKRLEFLFRR